MRRSQVKAMVRLILCVAIVASGFFRGGMGKHFRGGTLSWRPIEGETRKVELNFRLTYRYPFFSDPKLSEESGERGEDCTHAAVAAKTPTETSGRFDVIRNVNGENVRTFLFDSRRPSFICTDIKDSSDDTTLNWASGENTINVTLPEQDDNIWDVGMFFRDSCCWLRDVVNYKGKKEWVLRTIIDLSPRRGIGGKPNTPPRTEGLPIKTVIQGCQSLIRIEAFDADRDRLKCRWTDSEKEVKECGNPTTCGNPNDTIFTMKTNDCNIKVNATNAEAGLYAVAVIIEDFRGTKGPFSKIFYHFLVNIVSNEDCGPGVHTLPPEPCYAVPFIIDPPFKLKLNGSTTNSSVPIHSFEFVKPSRMSKSEVYNYDDFNFYVEVSWSPVDRQPGDQEILCFEAVNVKGLVGGQQCTKLLVGGTTPTPIPWHLMPGYNESIRVNHTEHLWTLYFSEEVKLNKRERAGKVTFFFENDTVAHEVNITKDNVGYKSTEEPFYVQLRTPDFNLTSNTTYTIRLSRGAVVGTVGCSVPSEEAKWQFTTMVGHPAEVPTEAPPTPDVFVECKPTYMIAYIEKARLPDIDPSILSYNDPDCNGTYLNETHIAVRTMYGKCGTRAVLNEDESRVSMLNHLYLPPNPSFIYGDEPVVTRSENFRVVINCSIPVSQVNYVEFNTNTSVDETQADATGNFNFGLKMYRDENYRHEYTISEFPVKVQHDGHLYFEATTFRKKRKSELFLDKCVATPAAVVNDSLQYTLIKNGCPTDETVEIDDSPNDSKRRFSVQAFSFIGYNLQSSIFVYCEMKHCNKYDGSCDTDCPETANRRKRSMGSLEVGTVDKSSDNGPVTVITRSDHAGCDKREDSISVTEVSLMCLVFGVLCVIMLQTYLVAIWSRQAKTTGQKLQM